MKLIHFDTASGSPDSQEWHDWRNAGVGASDAPVIAAAHGLIGQVPAWLPSLHKLWLRKIGQAEPLRANAAMQRGRDGEGPAREAFEELTGIPVSPVFGEMDAHPFVRASFDGMTFDQEAIVEIKCPSQKVHQLAKEGQVVEYYLPQIAHQAMVAWGHPDEWKDQMIFFYSFVPETHDGALVEVRAQSLATLARDLLPREIDFWQHVLDRTPISGDAFAEAARRWKALMAEADALDAEIAQARQEIIDLMAGRPKVEAEGVIAYVSEVKGRVDYDALLKALNVAPEIIERYRGASKSTVVVRRASK